MTQAIPILLYHSVTDTPLGEFGPFTVSKAQFSAHLDRVREEGFTTLTLGELLEQLATTGSVAPRTAVITFDDGFADFGTNAWPALVQRDMSTTLYVTAGTIGATSRWLAPLGAARTPMLDAAEIRELAAAGCEFGTHSVSHPQLDCVPREVAVAEIRECKDVLEQLLGARVDSFAYPHGYFDGAVRQMVVDAGYTSATAVRNALSHVEDDRFALARVTVMAHHTPDQIADVLHGRGIGKAMVGERLRTRGYRYVRRWKYRRAAVQRG